jgi:RNA polymerase sigma-70 factor (ECF subfamily)
MFRTATETGNTATCDWANWTDEELLLEYRSTGQRGMFEKLVHRYERELYTYLYRYLRNTAAAEDAFQQTFTQVLEKCSTFDSNREFRPWLYKIATNQAIDRKRRVKNRPVVSIDGHFRNDADSPSFAEMLESNETEPAEEAMEKELVYQVRKAVDKLPEKQKQAIYLIYFQGLTYREAAEVVGVHSATLSWWIKNAVKRLNVLLKNVG